MNKKESERDNLKRNKPIKAGNFFIGLFGWAITHNLLFILFLSLFNLFTDPKKDIYAISLTTWLVVVIVIRVLFIKKKFWIYWGIGTTILVNALLWIWGNYRVWSLGKIILMAGLPYPLGQIYLLVN